MIILTDGRRTAEFEMSEWNGTSASPDWSNEFFECGGLPKVWVEAINKEAYLVKDVEYCADQVEDWAKYRGDYYDPQAKEYDQQRGVSRCFDVRDLT